MVIVGVPVFAVSSVVVAGSDSVPPTSAVESAPVDDGVVSTTIDGAAPTMSVTHVTIEDIGPAPTVADTPSPRSEVAPTASAAEPSARRDGDFSVMALLDVQPTSYDWGSVRVGEVGPWVTFVIDLDGFSGRIGYGSDLGVQVDEASLVTCGDRHCLSVRFAPHMRGLIHANLYIGNMDTREYTVVPTTGIGLATEVAMSVGSLSFGDVPVGTTSVAQTVTFRNVGDVDVDVTRIGVTEPFTRAGGSCASSATVVPGADCTIDVAFRPTAAGPASGSVRVSTAQESAATAALTGTGLPLAVRPTTVDLGDVTVFHEAAATVTIDNLTDSPVPIGLSGASAPFTLDDDCTGTLPSRGSCTVTVVLAPTEPGAATSSFTVASPADGSLQEVAVDLTGRRVAADVTVTPADAGRVLVGESATTTVTITNAGSAAVTISDVAVPAPFNTVSAAPCVGDLAPQASCEFDVAFDATAPGAASATLVVHHLAGEAAATMQGFGATTGLLAEPSSVDFGSLLDGARSLPVVTVTNTGNADATLGTLSLDGPFELVDDGCSGITLAASASCQLSVRYVGASAGVESGRISVTGVSAGRALATAVELTGPASGSPLTIEPSALDFGDVGVGQRSPGRSVTVVNDSAATVTITGVDLQGGGPAGAAASTHGLRRSQQAVVAADFELSAAGCLDRTLDPGESCAVSVIFAPRSAGLSTGSLRFETDGGSRSITLTGTGVAATPAGPVPEGTLPNPDVAPTPARPAPEGTLPATALRRPPATSN